MEAVPRTKLFKLLTRTVYAVNIFTWFTLNNISLYFVPGLLKRQNHKFVFIFSSQTLITCFGFAP